MLGQNSDGVPLLRLRGLLNSCSRMETVRSLERVRSGQLSSLKYRSSIKTCLAATHVMSNVTLDQKEQVSTMDSAATAAASGRAQAGRTVNGSCVCTVNKILLIHVNQLVLSFQCFFCVIIFMTQSQKNIFMITH